MPDTHTMKVEELLSRNPKADANKVRKAMEYLKILKDNGIDFYGYRGHCRNNKLSSEPPGLSWRKPATFKCGG